MLCKNKCGCQKSVKFCVECKNEFGCQDGVLSVSLRMIDAINRV